MDPAAFLEKRTQTRVEEQVERILSGAKRLSELPTTRATTKERLLQECAKVHTALQELVAVYVHYVSETIILYSFFTFKEHVQQTEL